jgi:hypothetical protein
MLRSLCCLPLGVPLDRLNHRIAHPMPWTHPHASRPMQLAARHLVRAEATVSCRGRGQHDRILEDPSLRNQPKTSPGGSVWDDLDCRRWA